MTAVSPAASSAVSVGAVFDFASNQSSHQLNEVFFGAGLTQTEITILYTQLKIHLTAVSAWV